MKKAVTIILTLVAFLCACARAPQQVDRAPRGYPDWVVSLCNELRETPTPHEGPLSVPEVMSPDDDDILYGQRMLVIWGDVPGAEQYNVRLLDLEGNWVYTMTYPNSTSPYGLWGLSLTNVEPNEYGIQVRARNALTESAWSRMRQFMVQ